MLKEGINEIEIKSYDELVDLIQGKDKRNAHDLREDFIFRGLSNVEYELIPSSLRKNELNQLNIDDFIGTNHEFFIAIDENEAKKNQLKSYSNEVLFKSEFIILVDKNGTPTLNKNTNYKAPKDKLQREKEYYILQEFFKYADKCGLKVNTNESTRELIHPNLSTPLDELDWLYNFREIMSLAQHYGLPTKALDWSYDYKVSLYFAVKDVLLKENLSDCVLWALNYKLFENQTSDEYHVNLNIYRPEYNTNPNLNAQKGLFTFLDQYVGDYECPLDKIISDEIKQNIENRCKGEFFDRKIITVPPQLSSKDTIFYKFIIPKEIKAEILKELYLEGYSEEYLFPGYDGVTKSVINRVKLKNLFRNPKILKKNILLSVEWDIDKVKSKEKLYEFIKKPDFEFDIDRIFIYQNNEVIGHFSGNEILKDSSEKLWNNFGRKSGISETEFDKSFKDSNCIAIRINDLNLFEYPIKLYDLNLENGFCYIEKDNEDLNFLLNFI